VGLGRAAEALPQFEQSLAMRRRLHGGRDHKEVAQSLNNVAWCLLALGRTAEALPQFEMALAMRRRVFGEGPNAIVAMSLNNVAFSLHALGRPREAQPLYEECLAVYQRLFGERDHDSVVKTLNNLGVCLRSLGRPAEALAASERALAMARRLCGDQDHPLVARNLGNVASCLQLLGRADESLPLHEQALAMRVRLGGNRDHPEVARCLDDLAGCMAALGRTSEALAKTEAAIAMIERLRDEVRLSPELRQSFFENLKRGGAFDRYQNLASRLGRPTDALHAAERSRGRGLLDQLASFGDPEIEAQRRARLRGDEASAARLAVLRTDLETEYTASDRLLHELTTLAERPGIPDREQRRGELIARSNAVSVRLRQLFDERARLLGDVLPIGRIRTAADIQAALQPGELLLEFTVTADVALVYVVARDGEVQVSELPNAFATVQRVLPELLQRCSRAQLRGREPRANGAAPSAADAASTELFASLIPAPVWEKVRDSRRVFVAAHRELHCVPFELLATAVKDGKPVYWLDEGPPISYVPSGTLLHWLRQRAREAGDDATSLDLLAIGDPRAPDAAPEVPQDGAFVLAVNDGGEGARAGLLAGDVLVKYDGRPIADDKALRDARMATERAIEDGQRAKAPIVVDVWRRGETRVVEVQPGQLGIQVGAGRARAAFTASLGGDAQLARITRAGDLERIRSLPTLAGARAETEVIDKVFAERKAKTRRLLGADATEPAVFDLASKAKYVHFACHGIAEEYAGQSLSMLVLSQPQHVLPGDDGLLKLSDLWNSWRGRLSSCRLVVLSACRTNVGPTLRDEAPQALPIGFLFAGVPAVISSLWAVDDASTRELMTDFYGRLLAGETDKLAAFTAAKKALRAKYPDPFHWAPFLFLGSPE
jgi:tetratricopeptide (TPR) repeat protein